MARGDCNVTRGQGDFMAISSDATAAPQQIRLPVRLTFGALIVGLALGWALSDSSSAERMQAIAGPVGTLWVRGLQMTIVPLIAALLVAGIVRMVAAAQAGVMARRTLAVFICVWALSVAVGALGMPALLAAFPIPGGAGADLSLGTVETQTVPGLGAFFESLVASNVVAAAAQPAMLPLVVFFVAFAVAITRLREEHRDLLVRLFDALGQAMLTIIGWVLRIAPVGVFALALGVGLGSGERRAGALHGVGHFAGSCGAGRGLPDRHYRRPPQPAELHPGDAAA